MKRIVEITAAVALVAMAPTAAFAASKTIEVDPFTEIEISSGIDATISIGDVQSIVAESPDAAQLEEMIVEVRGGRFHAYVDWSIFDLFSLGADRRIHLTITVPAVEAIESNSGSDVTASGVQAERLRLSASSGANLTVRDVVADTADLEASSGADLNVAGSCGSARAEASSGADLDAGDLVCESVKVEASSGANASVNATSAVDAEASSGAGVDVHGNPADVRNEESSGGDVSIR
jgi:hypothetical protein